MHQPAGFPFLWLYQRLKIPGTSTVHPMSTAIRKLLPSLISHISVACKTFCQTPLDMFLPSFRGSCRAASVLGLTYTVMSIHLRSPFSVVFLLHLALEMPIAIQGVWQPISLPFLQLNNTTLVFLKLYSALLLASCIVSGLCFSLPEFMPGKRALAIGLCIYHSIASTILFQAPRFIPYSFGPFMEQQRITPEIVWGICHGILGLGMVVWWQATVQLAAMARASGPPQG